MAKEAIEGFIACMITRGEEVPIESDDSMICTLQSKQMPKFLSNLKHTLIGMAKLPCIPPEKLARILEKCGFVLERINGSHHF